MNNGNDRPEDPRDDGPGGEPGSQPPPDGPRHHGNPPGGRFSQHGPDDFSQRWARWQAEAFGTAQPGEGGGAPPPPRRPTRPAGRRRSPLGPTIVILFVLAFVVSWVARFWTDVMWFDSVGYTSVFFTQIATKAVLGVILGLLAAGLVGSSMYVAHRTRPVYAPTPQTQAMEQYRAIVDPMRRFILIGGSLGIGVLAGLAASSGWDTFLLWRNRTPFGTTDAHFGQDIGFYVFELPWYEFLVGYFTMILIVAAMTAAFTHYLYGGLIFGVPGRRTTQAARIHLSVLFAGLALVRAVGYWLERYSMVTAQSDRITGIRYTDANATLPAKAILAVAALMCAAMFISAIWTKTWRLPLVGVALLTVTAIVVGGIFPALMQSLKVKPSEKSLEEPYFKRNIDATLQAYGLKDVEKTLYEPTQAVQRGQLRGDAATLPGIRLLDPNVVSATYQQLQANKPYYAFADSLDVDRYRIEGQVRDTVVAVRELNLQGTPARNWINDHTVYTHGFGVVASYGNRVGPDGRPAFYQQGIPSKGQLSPFEERVYFGEGTADYSIVGAPEGVSPREFDYPDDEAGDKKTTYQGVGGVPMDNLGKRLAYMLKYREINFLLSDAINDKSRLMDHRTPRERVTRVAPWLTLDGNAYPAVVGGQLLWILDAYTTTANYPYSQVRSMDDLTEDSVTRQRASVRAINSGQVNYIRNSVKATVNAYDGTVTLYAWDDTDPILKAWMGVFPDKVTPRSQISGELMQHLRYPEDLFKIQRELLATYHVNDPQAFYGGNDFWEVPDDPTFGAQAPLMPPYYLSLAMPGQNAPSFSLTTAYKPTGDRQNLSGFLAVDADAGSTAGQPKAGYGKLRLLEISRAVNVKGPGQVQNDISSSDVQKAGGGLTLSQYINLNKQQGSTVTLGNLLTLPVGGGLLYVQPIYIQGKTGSSFPLLRAVAVSFGDKLAWGDTLDAALDGLFGGDSGAVADPNVKGAGNPTPGATPAPTPSPSPSPSPSASPSPSPAPGGTGDLNAAIAEINAAYAEGQAALRNGDFAAYDVAQKKLKAAIDKAVAASGVR